MTKKKILHVVHDFLFGGIEGFIYYLTQAQMKNENIEVNILCCQRKDKVANKRIINTGIKCHYVPVEPWDFNIAKYKKIMAIAGEYDIVHIHMFKPLLAQALAYAKAKRVYTNHSAGSTGRSQSLTIKAKSRLQVRYLNKHVDAITNNSRYTKDFWISKGVRSEGNYVIYNGVLFNGLPDKSRPLSEFPQLKNKFIVGTTSRFITWKRIDRLIEAFAIFQREKDDTLLLLVGDGSEKERLAGLARSLGISEKVVFTGFKTNVADYQSVMDVCVFASDSEPFGLVAIECMHLGKPTLVFKDGGGLAELVAGIERENIVADINSLASLLDKRYARHFQQEKEDNRTERIRYAGKFDINRIEKEFYDLYTKV